MPADQAALNRRLLELNATDLLHGSYGIDGDAVVLTEALELSHLDFEEFLASYESMTLSLTRICASWPPSARCADRWASSTDSRR
jgi:hypothetical protein